MDISSNISNPSIGTIAYYTPDMISYSHYLPFGQVMPNRHGNDNQYRYGYQGSEKDDEIKGNGNSYTTEFRQLDPRLGRWLSIDPLSAKYPGMSPYNSMNNNPIISNDVKGDSPSDPPEAQALSLLNSVVTSTISAATLVVTSVGAPITRAIYSGVTGKMGYNITPVTFTENWEFKGRHDLMEESLTPKQGKEVIGAYTTVLTSTIPLTRGATALEKTKEELIKQGFEKLVEKGMNSAINSDKNSYEFKLNNNKTKITQRQEILNDHRNQLQTMKDNKSEYTNDDFRNMYKQLDYDYNRLSSLRKEQINLFKEKNKSESK